MRAIAAAATVLLVVCTYCQAVSAAADVKAGVSQVSRSGRLLLGDNPKCVKCNIPENRGGCKCDDNCDCRGKPLVSGSGAGGSGGLPTIIINNANANNNDNTATGGNAKGGSASTRGLLQTPNNQNRGAIGGNAVSGDATGNGARSGDARGGDARIDDKMTKVDTKIDSKVNGKLFGKRKLLDNVADVMPSTRVLLQSPNNQNNGAIGGNAVSGDAKGDNSRTGDARGGDARIDQKMTKVDTKIDSKVNGKLFG